MQDVKLVQISDTHITTTGAGYIAPDHVEEALRRAVGQINALSERVGGIDAVIHTGDLVDRGQAEEYARFQEALAGLVPPFFALPGNHDAREAMWEAGFAASAAASDEHICHSTEFGAVRALLLDSVIPGASGGRLGEVQIAWAAEQIDAAAAEGRPALVFAHHPPFASGVPFMDDIRMEDGEALTQMLAARENVRLFACGHHHRMITTAIGQTPAIAAPSIAPSLEMDFRADAKPTPSIDQSAFLLHVWRAGAARFGDVRSYMIAI